MGINAIPTTYAGVNFRSRLEATWAAMFDELGWPWQYEPVDFDGYIPDFALSLVETLFVEVKPALKFEELWMYRSKPLDAGVENLAIVGACCFEDLVGIHIECTKPIEKPDLSDIFFAPKKRKESPGAPAYLLCGKCNKCGQWAPLSVDAYATSARCLACGEHTPGGAPADAKAYVDELFKRAKNTTQWRSR